MICLKHHLKAFKNVHVPTPGPYFRKQMPQLNNAEQFIDLLLQLNITTTISTMEVKHIKMSQADFNLEKVRDMITAPTEALRKGFLVVSKDGYLLDGHHRVIALLNKSPIIKVPVYIVDCERDAMIYFAKIMGDVEFRDVNESVKDVLKTAKSSAKELLSKLKNSKHHLGVEWKETKEMLSTAVDFIKHKVSKKARPSDKDIKAAIAQMKDVAKIGVLAPVLVLPGSVPAVLTIEMIANKLGKSILPSEFSLGQDL